MKYIKLDPDVPDLIRGTPFAAGIDLCSVEKTFVLKPQGHAVVSCGIAIEVPEGYFGHVSARSSVGFKLNVATHIGVIDSDYRGEMKMQLFNHSNSHVEIAQYNRIGQLILIPYLAISPELVEELSTTERGEKGVGSTGR